MSGVGTSPTGGRAQQANLRTPIGKARGLGSGKTGTAHWWWLRVTSVALALLAPWLIGVLVSLVGADLDTVRMALAQPWNTIASAMFVLALFWHAQMGVQVVIEDYVHTRSVEIALQLINLLACTVGALASLYAIGRSALMA